MKRMKKIMALMLAAIMMMAMSVTAFAAEGVAGTHTLTVNVNSTTPAQDLKGQTINLYKLFDVTESKSGETTNYAYTVNNTYKAALASDEKLAGAKFSLYTSAEDAKNGKNAIKVSGSNGNYVVDPASTTTEFESVKSIDGKGYNLHINGLEAKDYWLVETQAPEGFVEVLSLMQCHCCEHLLF